MEVNPNFTEKARQDYELVVAAREKGDQRAYAELMKRYRDSIFFMLLKMTNDPDDADDLTIEAFGKAFRYIGQYSPDFAFSTWLFKIASNNCIDFIRRKKKDMISIDKPLRDEEQSAMSQSIASDSDDPEEAFMKDQKYELLREVVEKLKPRYRRLVEMRYFGEYSYEEIATELNLPLGTVKAQLFRARDLLFNVLKDSRDNL